MTKEIYIDRGGKVIRKELLSEYDIIGIRQYNKDTNEVIWLVERHKPYPVLGVAIILAFALVMIGIALWCIISLI